MVLKLSQKNVVSDLILKDIALAISSLDFGTITIKIHETKVIQIEVTEKKRYDDPGRHESGGGI